MKTHCTSCYILEIIPCILLVGILPLQIVAARWGFCPHYVYISYNIFTLLTFIVIVRCRCREISRLSTDVATKFLSRTAFDIQKTSKEMTYLLYIRMPILEDFTTRYGLEAEQEAIEKIAEFISYAFKAIAHHIYRYGERSLVVTTPSDQSLSEIVTFSGAAIRKIYQYALPFPQFSTELRVPLHVGILEIATVPIEEKSRYMEYVRFPLQSIDNPLEPSVRIFNKLQYDSHMKVLLRQTHVPSVIYNEEVKIVFQPIQNIATGELYGYEALSRPQNPQFGHIGELLSDADESGLYINLEVCLTYAAIDTYIEKQKDPSIRLFLNFAPESIRSRVYTAAIESGIFSNIPIVFEIVERGEVLPDIVRILRETTESLSSLIALDDFGTGYSNHLALLNARPDIIKVSRELLMGIDKDFAKQQVYSNIVMFAHNLQTQVLAEGIETEEEFQTLLRLGMNYAQGYFIGRPSENLTDVSDRSRELCKNYQNT